MFAGKRTAGSLAKQKVFHSVCELRISDYQYFLIYLSIPDLKVYFCNFFLTQGVWNKKDFFKSMGMLRQWSGFGNDMIMEKMWTWLKKQMYPQLLAFLDFFFKNFQSQLSQGVCTYI